jgi:hypothetical protein
MLQKRAIAQMGGSGQLPVLRGFSCQTFTDNGAWRSAIFCTRKKGGAISQKVFPFATSPRVLVRVYFDPCEGIVVAHNTVCAS